MKDYYLYRLIPFSIVILLVIGCEKEIKSVHFTDPIPVVYFIYNGSTDLLRVKLTKSFVGEQNAYQMSKMSDSSYFMDARVYVESRDGGYLIDKKELFRDSSYMQEPGLFLRDPNILYVFEKILVEENDSSWYDTFQPTKDMRLIIEIPEINKTVFSHFSYLYLLKIRPTIPRNYDISLFSGYPCEIEWVTDAYFSEIRIGFHYLEYKSGVEEKKYIEWISHYATYDMGLEGKNLNGSIFTHQLNPYVFFSQVGGRIKDDPKVSTRLLRSIDLMIYTADENMYDYLQTIDFTGIDQTGLPFSNITNGVGLCASVNKQRYSGYKLSERDLDSLSKGQFTKHLKFRRY